MANNVVFHMVSAPPVTISERIALITKELSETTVKSITVGGDPWVFFDSQNYGGDFVIYKEGKAQPFPRELTGDTIKSARRICGGIQNSQVIFYSHPFFEDPAESLESKTPQLLSTYLSLKVTEGAVIFFDDENYTGGKRILLKGDEVQNFTAVKLTSIGKSMKTALDMVQQ